MAPPVVSRRAVAALFIARQHLARPRDRRLTARSLLAFVEDVGGLQLDSINVVERAHHLTLWSRFGPYDRKVLERIAYRRRLLFEYWAHAACLVPASHFPSWRRVMLDYSVRTRAWGDWLKKNRAVLRAVEAAITANGPMSNADFAHRRAPGSAGGWWNWKPAAHALDYLWMSGRTQVHSRKHFQKRFDLAERLMPEAMGQEPLTPRGVPPLAPAAIAARHGGRERDRPAHVPHLPAHRGWRKASALCARPWIEARSSRSRSGALAAAGWPSPRTCPRWPRPHRKRRPASGTTLLSPFDSFLWHRDRTRQLFGFDYTLEVYTPGPKRVHGYYSLPIFHDGQLIGRLDPKTHRAENRLEVKAVHFEPWFAKGEDPPAASWGLVDRDEALAGVGEALRSLATFVGADHVTVGRVSPPALGPALKRAVKA